MTSPLRVGLTLPSFREEIDPLLEVAVAAERAGLDAVFAYDHLFRYGATNEPIAMEIANPITTSTPVSDFSMSYDSGSIVSATIAKSAPPANACTEAAITPESFASKT